MELFLYRVYDSCNLKRFLFSEDDTNVDSFTLNYKNNSEMIGYFNQMPVVYKEDGSIDYGRFAVFSKNETIDRKTGLKVIELKEEKIYFSEDLDKIDFRLRQDDMLLIFLLENYKHLFESGIYNILLKNTKNLPACVSRINHATLTNCLKTGYISVRKLDNAIIDYDSMEIGSYNEKKSKVLVIKEEN